MTWWDDLIAIKDDIIAKVSVLLDPVFARLAEIRAALDAKLDGVYDRIAGEFHDVGNYLDARLGDALTDLAELKSGLAALPGKIDSGLSGILKDLRDLKKDIADFLTFAWFDELVLKIESAIDRRASALFGIDPAKPFWDELAAKIDVRISQKFGVDPKLPFFDALWAKIERKVDIWFSKKLDIDPDLPFWDELEKKIIALAVKIASAALDAVLPDAAFWNERKRRAP